MVAAMLGMFLPSGFFRPAEVSAAGKTVASVSVKSKPAKLKYNAGDKLSTKGLKLTVRYKGGSKGTVSSGFTCSPTKLTKAGTQKITVKYGGKTTSFNVTVSKSRLPKLTNDNVAKVLNTQIRWYIQLNCM